MDTPFEGIDVIRLDRSDPIGIEEARGDLRRAFEQPQPRVLMDVTPLESVDGMLLAAMFVACKAVPTGGRIALLASEDVLHLIHEWDLDDLWRCFSSEAQARAYLSDGPAALC